VKPNGKPDRNQMENQVENQRKYCITEITREALKKLW